MNDEIAGIRKDYSLKTLDENDVAANPFQQFSLWWNEAMKSEIAEVNAMTLATASKNATPHARIVLLKSFDQNSFIFFTNYESNKGNELENNAKAALVFFWKELERQVRIEGTVKKIAAEESDAYFNSRPEGSRIGAWSSPQSSIIAGRDILEENVKKFTAQFASNIPRPQNWGGYAVVPVRVEFWQGRSNRLHDRILYSKTTNGIWKIERLAP